MIEGFIKGIVSISQLLTPKRLRTIKSNIRERTNFITVVIDDINQISDISAVIRSADAFGIIDVYVVENKNKFDIDKRISNGAEKWLNIKKFLSYEDCYRELKENNYKICVAVAASKKSVFLDKFEIKDKIAIVLEHETVGGSDFFKERADVFLSVRMRGFVESLNLPVAIGTYNRFKFHFVLQFFF